MDWHSPFVVYRITPEGKLQEVFHAHTLKKARYWLQYIAQPGDVCCMTPMNAKHSQKTPKAEYLGHKEKSGQPTWDEKRWAEIAKSKNISEFPAEQLASVIE